MEGSSFFKEYVSVVGIIYRHYSKGLANDGVEEPEEQVVGVSADLAL